MRLFRAYTAVSSDPASETGAAGHSEGASASYVKNVSIKRLIIVGIIPATLFSAIHHADTSDIKPSKGTNNKQADSAVSASVCE